MRALSIRAPWWFFVLHAGKRIENRSWKHGPRFMLGQTFLLHSSSWWNLEDFADDFEAGKDMAREEDWARVKAMSGPLTPRIFKDGGGKIVGRARLADLHRGEMADPWAVPDALHLVLADVETIADPIPFKGALGFFEVPDSVLAGATWTAVSS